MVLLIFLGLQVVMKSIMRAMVPLLQVLVLTLFVIVIYATVGLSFLVDKFHATCFDNTTGNSLKPLWLGGYRRRMKDSREDCGIGREMSGRKGGARINGEIRGYNGRKGVGGKSEHG